MTKIGSLIGQGMEYDMKGGREINSERPAADTQQKLTQISLLPFSTPPQECIELHVQEWSDRSNVFPLVLLLSP